MFWKHTVCRKDKQMWPLWLYILLGKHLNNTNNKHEKHQYSIGNKLYLWDVGLACPSFVWRGVLNHYNIFKLSVWWIYTLGPAQCVYVIMYLKCMFVCKSVCSHDFFLQKIWNSCFDIFPLFPVCKYNSWK